MHDDYFAANRRNWDERAVIHAQSEMYNLDAYRADRHHLSSVVAFDRRYLGDLSGQSALHLQCHIGTDTLSLARLGAAVTGLDQSATSIRTARQLFADTDTAGRFEIASVYDAPQRLGEQYDLLYTGVGALNWLPEIRRWAQVVAALLKPGGRLYLREGHPMLWALADTTEDDSSLRVGYPYFETPQPTVFDEQQTYTGDDATINHTRTYEWNHGLGEIVTALLQQGLTLLTLDEHDTLEWQMFPHMQKNDDGRYQLPPEQRAMVPLMYTLIAERRDR